ncbi:hypothetical protein MTO96_007720 [Rhipicephalus appendiculatus]
MHWQKLPSQLRLPLPRLLRSLATSRRDQAEDESGLVPRRPATSAVSAAEALGEPAPVARTRRRSRPAP